MPEPVRYRMMPEVPTDKMVAAGIKWSFADISATNLRDAWFAMLAAAPDPAEDAALVELVARAIYESDAPSEETYRQLGIPMPPIYQDQARWTWDRLSPAQKDFHLRQTRAVVALMRGRHDR